jgi:hypothetical protein
VKVAVTLGQGEAAVDEAGLDRLDEHGQVELHRVALDLDGTAGLAGQHRDHLRVRLAVRLLPGGGEFLGLDQLAHLGVHEVVDAVVERRQQRPEARRGSRRQAALRERVHCLLRDGVHVEPISDGVADPRGDDGLDGGVVGQGSDGLHVPVGVRHRVVRPRGHDGQRCQYCGQEQAHADHDLAPPLRPRFGSGRTTDGRRLIAEGHGQPDDLCAEALDLRLHSRIGVVAAGGSHDAGCSEWMCSVRSRRAPTMMMNP